MQTWVRVIGTRAKSSESELLVDENEDGAATADVVKAAMVRRGTGRCMVGSQAEDGGMVLVGWNVDVVRMDEREGR